MGVDMMRGQAPSSLSCIVCVGWFQPHRRARAVLARRQDTTHSPRSVRPLRRCRGPEIAATFNICEFHPRIDPRPTGPLPSLTTLKNAQSKGRKPCCRLSAPVGTVAPSVTAPISCLDFAPQTFLGWVGPPAGSAAQKRGPRS